MRKVRRTAVTEMRPEYDFASMKGGVRGKYVRRLRSGSNLVLLEPDMAEAFSSVAAVNQALRAALNVAARYYELECAGLSSTSNLDSRSYGLPKKSSCTLAERTQIIKEICRKKSIHLLD